MLQQAGDWFRTAPLILLGGGLLLVLALTAWAGYALRGPAKHETAADGGDSYEGYLVSAVLGLLALLLGFTFSLAVDRYETRRKLVLEEANAIGTAYLRAQLLEEPHRTRIGNLLVAYTANRVAVAKTPGIQPPDLVAKNDRYLADLWAATSAAFDTIKGIDFSSSFIDSINTVIDLNTARKTAVGAHIPPQVFLVLFVYVVVTAGVLGYVLTGQKGRISAAFLLLLLTLSMILIVDIDRPNTSGARGFQTPMEDLLTSFQSRTHSALPALHRGAKAAAIPAPPSG